MNFSAISAGILGLSSSFTPWLLLAIFIITMVAQFGVFVPYLLESIWLFSGYNVILGVIPPLALVALCLVGIIGREVGSGAFFYVSSCGSEPLERFYRRRIQPRLAARRGEARPGPLKRGVARLLTSIFCKDLEAQTVHIFGRPLRFSPFNVALGHFLWMRVPIIMTLGLKGKMRPLLLGVALFSVISDGVYILIGILGGTEGVSRTMMLLYPLGLMALIFGTSFGVRRMSRQLAARKVETSNPELF
jgi:hypothetical protein